MQCLHTFLQGWGRIETASILQALLCCDLSSAAGRYIRLVPVHREKLYDDILPILLITGNVLAVAASYKYWWWLKDELRMKKNMGKNQMSKIIMVVDDEPDTVDLVKLVLKLKGLK